MENRYFRCYMDRCQQQSSKIDTGASNVPQFESDLFFERIAALNSSTRQRSEPSNCPPQPAEAKSTERSQKFWKNNFLHILTITESIVDFSVIFVSFIFGFKLYAHLWPGEIITPPGPVKLSLLIAISSIPVFERLGLYKRELSIMNIDEIRKIIRAFILICLVLIIFSQSLDPYYNPISISICIALALVITIFERMLFFKLHQFLHRRGLNVENVLIFGAGDVGRLLYQNIKQSPKIGFRPIGFLDENSDILETTKEWYKNDFNGSLLFLSDVYEVVELAQNRKVDRILIARPTTQSSKIHLLLNFCQNLGLEYNYVPYLYGLHVENIMVQDLNGVPLLSPTNIKISRSEQITKYLFDIFFSSLLLVALSPLLIIIAFLIYRDSPGPIFFRQERGGKDGKPFQIYKFRTMYVDAPKYGYSPRSSSDPRITPIGRFLRKTSLDELPQLINVFRGEMSLVGPRPEMPFIIAQYNELQKVRLQVKPGITGVWQISADRDKEIHDNISYDLFYVKNRSFLLDLIILARTVLFGVASMKTS